MSKKKEVVKKVKCTSAICKKWGCAWGNHYPCEKELKVKYR